MNTITITLDEKQIKKMIINFSEYLSNKLPKYVRYLIILTDCRISIYDSKKVVFQGKDAELYAQPFLGNKPKDDFIKSQVDLENEDTAGSDECGTGDFFGPVVVCACIVRKTQIQFVKNLKVDDSKKLTDKYIMEIAPILMENLEYNLLILGNKQYNEVYGQYNLNAIKALLHNQAYINLSKKTNVPKLAYVDQFTTINSYFKYLSNKEDVYTDLIFETKAESKYIAVACASIIARYSFVKSFENMQKHFDISFHKGANNYVIEDAKIFINKYGFNRLHEVAKMNFKTVNKII